MKRTTKRERRYNTSKQALRREHPEMFDEWSWLEKYKWQD